MSLHARRAAAAAAVLVAGALLALPRALPAQAEGGSAMRFTLGFALRPGDDVHDSIGVMLGFGLERHLRGRLAARLDAEVQYFGAGRTPLVYVNPPCSSPGCVGFGSYGGQRIGATVSASALANLVLYEQPDRRGFYVVAGLGPQFLLAHSDRSLGVRLAAQAGLGVSLGSVVVIEARYQATVGALAEPRHVVLFTFGLRHTADRTPLTAHR